MIQESLRTCRLLGLSVVSAATCMPFSDLLLPLHSNEVALNLPKQLSYRAPAGVWPIKTSGGERSASY